MAELNRRQFVVAAAAGACACLLGCASDVNGEQAGMPEPAAAESGVPVQLGALSDYQQAGIYNQWVSAHKLYLIHHNGRLYAASATCTHKACTLKDRSAELACPCHGSLFTLEGVPTKGPARRPLPRYAISIDGEKRVVVDRSRRFNPEQWDDPAAFIAMGD